MKISSIRSLGLIGLSVEVVTGGGIVGNTITSIVFDGTIDNINAYGTKAGDSFGQGGLVIQDNLLVIPAHNEDDANGLNNGKVYLVEASSGTVLRTIDDPNAWTATSSGFGLRPALQGNYIAVGAMIERSSSGYVYVFNLSGDYLYTLANPNAYGATTSDLFGSYVGIGGDILAVAAYGEADATGSNSGKVYVYRVTDGQPLYTLVNPNSYGTSNGDRFGWNIAVTPDGTKIAVSAPYEIGPDGATTSGMVYVYDSVSGSLLYSIQNPNVYGTRATDQFGSFLSASNTYLAVPASSEDSATAGSNSGVVYVFDINNGALLWTFENPNIYTGTLSDIFGSAQTAVYGKYLVAPATGEDQAGASNVGVVYVFDLEAGSLVFTLTNPNTVTSPGSDQLGYSVTINHDYIFAAAPGDDDGGASSGKVYRWKLNY